MLVVSRRLDEGLVLGGRFSVEITGVRHGAVRLLVKGVTDSDRSALRARNVQSGASVWCKEGEALELDAQVSLTPMMVRRSGTRLGIDAPRSVRVVRMEELPATGVVKAFRADVEVPGMRRWLQGLIIGLLVSTSTAFAQTASLPDTCPDSGFFSKGKAISDLCWNCFFPIKIAGVSSAGNGGGGGTMPSPGMKFDYDDSKRDGNRLPAKTASPICVCPGRFYGMPSPGITWGMWFPTHIIETVRRPWCSPALMGEELGNQSTTGFQAISLTALDGGNANGKTPTSNDSQNGSFYNFHWITFPIYEILESYMESLCSPGGWGGDYSYLYFTEFDPTWDNEMLALYTHPEIKVFANLYAKAVCIADGVMSTVKRPINEAIWCAGTWGSLYPYAGKDGLQNQVEAQMLVGARGLAAMHRRGLAKLTYTDRAVCRDAFWFVYPKQQYQYQNIWPVPQKKNNVWIGTTSWKFGQFRKAPITGEERLIMQWTYKECCYTFY